MAAPASDNVQLTDGEERAISSYFGFDCLYDHQRKVISDTLLSKDVFLSTKTSSGKSLCYQSIPVVYQHRQLPVIVLVISPLLSIMEEQVQLLRAMGFTATVIGKDPKENNDIKTGKYSFLYTNPETVLKDDEWREVLMTEVYRKTVRLIVVDEAHMVTQW